MQVRSTSGKAMPNSVVPEDDDVSDMTDEEPLELEPLEEIEPEETVEPRSIDTPSMAMSRRNFVGSPYPCSILDASLNIIWKNEKYKTLFGDGRTEHIISAFAGSFDEDLRNSLYQHTRSEEVGYSWRGKLQLSAHNKPTVIVNLLVGPIFENTEAEPSGYLAIFDDITDDQKDLIRGTFSSLLEASLLKDNDTGNHVKRVNEYCRIMSERLFERNDFEETIDHDFIDTIGFVAAMHDVGKIGTPDDILNKDGPLDDWEWDVMKEHTINGAYILNTYPAEMAKQIALFHHEWWDGSGYPYEISGDMIPLAARIVSLADVYDALRMKRSYKVAFSHEKACEILEEGENTHFDPNLCKVFLENHTTLSDVYQRFEDNNDTEH